MNRVCTLAGSVSGKICAKILPGMNDNVNKFTLERASVERILFAINYHELYCLPVVYSQQEALL